jgi:Protein of unknown function (DUF2695)
LPDNSERERRKQLVRAVAQKQRADAEARMPISKADLRDLFDYLDGALPEQGCKHSLQLTRSFLETRSLDPEAVVPWLAKYNGFCDCEVLANVEDAWQL